MDGVSCLIPCVQLCVLRWGIPMTVYIVRWSTGDNDICLGDDHLERLIHGVRCTIIDGFVYNGDRRVGRIVGC